MTLHPSDPDYDPTPPDFRAAGFTLEAAQHPRNETALRLLCAFNGVDWHAAPPAWWFHPNSNTRAAWLRVADEAMRITAEQPAQTNKETP